MKLMSEKELLRWRVPYTTKRLGDCTVADLQSALKGLRKAKTKDYIDRTLIAGVEMTLATLRYYPDGTTVAET